MLFRKQNIVIVALLLSTCIWSTGSVAQDSPKQSREPGGKMKISFVGVDGELLENIKKRVRLYARLQDASPVSKGERRRLKRHVANEVKQALQPFGYYLASVRLELAGSPSNLVYTVELNQPVIIKKISLSVDGTADQKLDFKDWLDNYSLQTGRILEQAKYEQDKKILLARALRLGYFGAKLTKSEIVINEARTHANIVMAFASGPRYSVSQVETNWDSDSETGGDYRRRIEGRLLDSYITMKSGDMYDADELIKTQRSLLTTPYFSSVSVQAGEPNNDAATLAINVTLTPRKRNAYSAEVGVGTDTGIRGGIGYENRRINSRGHNLSARLGGSDIKRSAILNYQIPKAGSAKDSLNFFAALEEEVGDARRFESIKIGAEYLKNWNAALLKLGLTASREKFLRALENGIESEQTTDLLMPSLRWERTKVDDPYFPTRGWSASAWVRGASKNIASDIDLVQIILDTKHLVPLRSGRIKFRFKVAGSLVDDAVALPESLGFLAGGDDSIRGYRFESIGVESNGETRVAKNLVVGSVEYEHPIKNGISWASFIDAGDAFDDNIDVKKGAGVGLRWRLPFGAMRLDVASALDKDGDPFRLHFSFGTDL